MLDKLRAIKLSLIMDALLKEKIEICNNPKIDRNYNVNNNFGYGMYNKSKRKSKIRK